MAHHPNDSQLQQPHTKSAIVVTEDKAEAQRGELRVLITNATTPMAHTIASAVAQGYVFGYEQPIILHLLDGKGTKGTLEGLVLELLDCTYPLLRQVVITSVDDAAFMGIDAAFLLYEAQDAPVDHGVQLFCRYGAALEKYAKKTAKVVVCGCQAAINAYACIQAAPSIDKRSITALTRLEHNQALAQIASKLAVAPNKVRNVVVWGGKGRVPDAYNAVFLHGDNLLPVAETLKDNYLSGEFIEVVNNRTRGMLNARSKYPSLSKGKAACDHMRDWWQGTAEGTWVSMGVVSDGAYGVPKGIVYSFPVRIDNKEWQIVEGIDAVSAAATSSQCHNDIGLVQSTALRLEMRVSLQPKLLLLLVEASLLLSAEAKKHADDALYREVLLHYANHGCELGLEKSSNKHVILVLPEDEDPCPFETSISEAVSAHAYSLVVARNFDLKSHLAYFTPESDVLVPRQDIILAEVQLKTATKFQPKNMSEWSAAPANGSALMGPTAKLYLVHIDMTTSSIVLGILACSTVAVGALWAGSTRKLLFLTLHRRIKPKDEEPNDEDANLDAVPAALTAPSSTSLGLATTISEATSEHRRKHKKHGHQHQQQQEQQQQCDVVRSRPYNSHQPKPMDDFLSADEEALNDESYFSGCPLDSNLVTLFVLAIAVNLLVLYYFFGMLWPILVGIIAIGSMMSLIIIFDRIAFIIPCASTRLTNFIFPCFVRSMELRHHITIWLAVSIPIVWIVFRKSEHAWILQDFLGSSFAINILRCIITLISVLLFFDDIFMVFVTSLLTKDVSVMESVATGVQDLPVLMRVPHFFPGESALCPETIMFLGYGDIAVPGLAVAYCRSYDVIVKKGMSWYFFLAIVCYATGLIIAMTVSSLMDMGQPALLYLVPAILLPVILLAWCRGDLKKFWNGDFVPKEGLMSARMDVCVSSSEQFQMVQGRGLLYVSTPAFPWLALPMPVSQKAYNAKCI
ncbi:hypothetical protein HPB51_006251 [Rhipicephalus microplus]|uniref:Malate dehydrogenase, cytoplasmic n=1 Tax=Rhipicephalus microplus TaxID=6941 RepID=A0A9J6DL40_RHIMP|nr:hypothetical protein HPB51_006251 [Rhipicephalus microplus]